VIYFAFGSNMDPAQMRARCPSHRVLGVAYLQDHALCFPRRSPTRACATAGLVTAKGDGVWGVLYALEETEIDALHEAEGYAPNRPAHQNRHVLIEVEVWQGGPGGHAVAAVLYRAQPDGSSVLPSEKYMQHLISGAEHYGLPAAYIRTLRAIETA
jgi:AIG2-like family